MYMFASVVGGASSVFVLLASLVMSSASPQAEGILFGVIAIGVNVINLLVSVKDGPVLLTRRAPLGERLVRYRVGLLVSLACLLACLRVGILSPSTLSSWPNGVLILIVSSCSLLFLRCMLVLHPTEGGSR